MAHQLVWEGATFVFPENETRDRRALNTYPRTCTGAKGAAPSPAVRNDSSMNLAFYLLGFVAGVLAGMALCCLWLLAAKDQDDD